PRQHREQDEAEDRRVGGRAVQVEAMRGDLAYERDGGEQEPERLERRQAESPNLELEGRPEDRRDERRAQEDQGEEQAERQPAVEQLDEGSDHELEIDPEPAVLDVEDVV